MTTLLSYVQKAIDLVSSDDFGRYVDITALTTTTCVAGNHLAFGGNNEQRYAQWWLWRPSTSTTADKVRNVDSFAPATGTLTHSGTNYSDTTATSEIAILSRDFEPQQWRTAVNLAVQAVREWDETLVPARNRNGDMYLTELSWIQDSASIREIRGRNSSILSRNRDFDKWRTVATDGTLTPPDYWTLAGASATVSRGTTNLYDGPYVASMVRSGTDATLTQNVGLLSTGVSGESLNGRTVTAVLICRATVASRVRVCIYENGSATASSSYHSGGSAYEELTVSATIASTTTALTFGTSLENGDTTIQLGRCYLQDGAVDDASRRDDQWPYRINTGSVSFEQGGVLKFHAPNIGFPAQFIVCSERAFPGFDATRLNTGAADTDESDAPLVPVALGTIANLYEAKLGELHPDAMHWRRKFSDACMKHLAYPTGEKGGVTMLNGPIASMPARVR